MDPYVIDLSSDDEKVCQSAVNLPEAEVGTAEKETQQKCHDNSKRITPVKISVEKPDADQLENAKKNGENKEEDVFEKFVEVCLKYDKSPSMKKIINNKVRRYYRNSNPLYSSSREFQNLVTEKTNDIITNPKNIYVPIKEVVDELRARVLKSNEPASKRRKLAHTDSDTGQEPNEDESKSGITETSEPASRPSDRLMRKLYKTMEILHRKIRKLEQKEVDWDEDNNSSYIQLQRYKERFCKVHEKLQEYEGEVGVGSRIGWKRVSFSGTKFPSVNRAIEKFVNKKGEFPDYADILKLLKNTYEEEKIGITPEQLRIQAKAAFQDVGGQLQKLRQWDYWNCHCVYLKDQKDPADEDGTLKSKLQENIEKYGHRIDEVIDSFAEKAVAQNLQPEGTEDNVNSPEDSSKNADDGSIDDEDEEEEEEEEPDDFIDKVLQGEDDIKENISSDGDEVDSLDNRYCGPVSPPSTEIEEEPDSTLPLIEEEECNDQTSIDLHEKENRTTTDDNEIASSEEIHTKQESGSKIVDELGMFPKDVTKSECAEEEISAKEDDESTKKETDIKVEIPSNHLDCLPSSANNVHNSSGKARSYLDILRFDDDDVILLD